MAVGPARAVARVTRAHHAIVTIDELRDAGITDEQRRRAVADGVLVRRHHGVYEVAAAPPTWESRAFAAWAVAGREAMLSHATGGHVWGLGGFGPPGMVDVLVPRHLRPRPRPGVRFRETTQIETAGRTMRRGLPVTGIARTVLDVCAVVPYTLALAALDEARRLQLVTWPELWECLVTHAVRGRPGIRRYRRVLVFRSGKTVPHGAWPRLFERMLNAAGVPLPEHEFWVVAGGKRYRLDMAYPRLKIAIELDDPSHDTERAREYDPARQNALELQGWLVLRYTWTRFITEPQAIVAEILAAITTRSGVR